jgi:hypothetical protein
LFIVERKEVTDIISHARFSLEVESNILASQKIKGNFDRRRPRNEASSSSSVDPKFDKMAKMLESLTSEISKIKIENK